MKQEFVNAVKEHKLAEVRMMLSNELKLDPRGETFSEMFQYAVDNLPDLLEEEKPMKLNIPGKELWDKDLVLKMKRELNKNFSAEKIALYEEMVKVVYANKAERLNAEKDVDASDKSSKTHRAPSQKTVGKIATGGGALMLTGGIVGLVKGTCTVGTILSIAGAAIMVGGVVLISKSNKKSDGK